MRLLHVILLTPLVLVSPLIGQEQRVQYGDWVYVYEIDAMTDSLGGYRAETIGSGVDPCCFEAKMTFLCPTVTAPRALMIVARVGRPDSRIPLGGVDPVQVRYRFDQDPASPWMEWLGGPVRSPLDGSVQWTLLMGGPARFVDQAKEARRLRLRFRKREGLIEHDLEFSLDGFSRAYAAACERN